LRHPLLNKGTAFTAEERRAFGLEGLLPHRVTSIDRQLERVYKSAMGKESPIERYNALAELQDRNETLFYRLLLERTEDLAPIVYTPTVGEACQRYSRIFRRGRGVWITPEHKGRMAEVLMNAVEEEIRLIVVTDNERILGLGDQGAGGIGIPIGKLALYTMGAGIHPSKTLPVSLDVGTDNAELLEDELYIGWRNKRLRGAEYDALVDEFVTAVKKCFPHALLQWEDFKKGNAFDLLDRYREQLCSFNDDIQGTAAVALAGVMAACRAKGETIAKQRVLILGAGAAGIGIATQIRDAMKRGGLEGHALKAAIALVDTKGLLVEGRKESEKHKLEFAWPADLAASIPEADRSNLSAVVAKLGPTVLIGTSAQPGVFDKSVVEPMLKHTARPVIFPLSNPTSLSEATPAELVEWTNGGVLMATGSPFDPVQHKGKEYRASQANNVYIFPGVGLGALVAEATRVTDSMFTVAAQTLADLVSEADLAKGALFPPLTQLRDVSARIAVAVVKEVNNLGLGKGIPEADIVQAVDDAMWYPDYPTIAAE
jgi:malate dehydrogenase (oxaloacetate-decarboxylating)